jgi:HSP20 family protein
MTLVKYNYNNNEFLTTVNGLMSNFLNDEPFDNTKKDFFSPSLDVLESKKSYELHFAIPGFDKKLLSIDVKKNVLIVSGERKFEQKEEEKEFASIQTQYGSFRKRIFLPEKVDKNNIDAKYVDGILKIDLPKEEVKTIKTTVKVK